MIDPKDPSGPADAASKPTAQSAGSGRPDPREARLAAALRANLRRRKAGPKSGGEPPAGA